MIFVFISIYAKLLLFLCVCHLTQIGYRKINGIEKKLYKMNWIDFFFCFIIIENVKLENNISFYIRVGGCYLQLIVYSCKNVVVDSDTTMKVKTKAWIGHSRWSFWNLLFGRSISLCTRINICVCMCLIIVFCRIEIAYLSWIVYKLLVFFSSFSFPFSQCFTN